MSALSKNSLLHHLANYEKAVISFETGFEQFHGYDLEKDGLIQRFEYTLELSRKTLKKILEYHGLPFEPYPRSIFKKAQEIGRISDTSVWFDFLEARNLASHTYDETLTKQLFDTLILPQKHHFRLLLTRLTPHLNALVD